VPRLKTTYIIYDATKSRRKLSVSSHYLQTISRSLQQLRLLAALLVHNIIQMMHDGQCDNLIWYSRGEVKMSSPRVDILTPGHIILEWCTMNIMHHMFCRMTNCEKKLSANENKQPLTNYQTKWCQHR